MTDLKHPRTAPRPAPAELDMDKLMGFVFRAVDEVGATLNAGLVVMGDKLGYYRALADGGPTTPSRLADATGTGEPYAREWLNAQAAGGFVDYDPATGLYELPAEHAVALTDESSPAFLPGFFQIALGTVQDSSKVAELARSGAGLGWHEHNPDVHEGCERFFRPSYNAHLVGEWLPALEGVVPKLEQGARVADIGCGHGASTVIMAQAFPRSTFQGSDYHAESIAKARARAEAAGVADRVSFEVASAQEFSGRDYDLVTTFDALHDMGDPVGAARHVRQAVADEGTWLVVEPMAGDHVQDNLTPVGRVYYGFSTLLCTPASLSQDVGLALGTQAGPAKIRDVVTTGGFTRFAKVAETPFNQVPGGQAVNEGRDPSRARQPDESGYAERDGVRLAYEVFGEGDTTVLLMPTWSIIDSRFWKAQVGYLARHFRVITFDGRGSGRSSRPSGAAAYTDEEYAADAVAVLDATGTEQAVLVALSCGVTWSVHVAARHPDRVLGLFAISPACGLAVAQPDREAHPWDKRSSSTDGWAKYNKHYWLEGGYEEFLEFFFGKMFTEPHSTKQIEDCVGWGLGVTPEVLADTTAGRLGCEGATCAPVEPLCPQVRCPVTVVHGTADEVRTWRIGERLAELTGGSLVLLDGVGHGPMARHPVRTNLLIREFIERVSPTAVRRSWSAASRRPKRALFLSSPIGLGHARRDLAIASELRKLHPDLEVDWLAQHPVTTVLAEAGERVHPASAYLANESSHIEHEAGEHDLHAFQAIREMDAILVNNFMVFAEVVEESHYDLVVGDEAWEVDYFLHENPGLKRFSFAWMTDFVGWLPMADGGEREARLTADYNAEMIEQRARFARVRDRSVFVGNPDDVVPLDFGPGLPPIRDWVRDNFDFAGYVTGFDSDEVADRDALRRRLGYPADQRLCVVTVGGSGVGAPLLHRILDTVPLVRRQDPSLHFMIVAGPRIDPAVLPRRRGVSLHGHVPHLYRHLAAADLAVVQGGLTTTMELTANQRPFVYVPLQHHFEQNFHVRHRLDGHGAGRCMEYSAAADPDALAAVILEEAGRDVTYRPVETDGAAVAAGLLADLL